MTVKPMTVKKDPSGRRMVEMAIDLPGTPEQIWRALATGPGYAAWFMPTEIEEREGGTVRFHIAEGVASSGKVTAWQPPFRFAYEEYGWSGEAPPLATEVVIAARDGGTCSVRMVHSLFTEREDWDGELEGMLGGWPPHFGILRLYLRDHAGAPSATARPTATFQGPAEAAWPAVAAALGLADAEVGETRDTATAGAPRLSGTIEDLVRKPSGSVATLRLAAPAPGAAMIATYEWGGTVHVAICLYFYGEAAEATLAEERPKWQAWLDRRFPQLAAVEPGA